MSDPGGVVERLYPGRGGWLQLNEEERKAVRHAWHVEGMRTGWIGLAGGREIDSEPRRQALRESRRAR